MGETKYIFVTGGVASSLGKGIISSSIGKLLQARGYKVTIQKFDPYINIDPGTLNPYEHGECYVTVDGHEADLDLGHYERFWVSRQPRPTTSRPAASTRVSSTRNVGATIWEKPSRSFRISRMKSNVTSSCSAININSTSSSPKSAEPSATSSHSPIWKVSAS